MSEPREAEIRARLEAATPGPWVESTSSDYFPDGAVVVREGLDFSVPAPKRSSRVVAVLTRIDGQEYENAAFIAHAPEDIGWLLIELGEVRAERDAARALAEEFREAEASISAAYVRVRAILKAWDTPPAPSGPQVWEVTERRAHEIVARVSRLQEALRELTARYGRPATESGGPFL